MGSGILPIAYHKGNVHILLGREVEDKKWSDFGGASEGTETTFETAIREGYEELNGFLGAKSKLRKRVRDYMLTKISEVTYTTYVFQIDYDERLPIYFNDYSKFVKERLPHLINKRGLFEKSEIQWFSINELRKIKDRLRPFYKTIVENIINQEKYLLSLIK